MRRSRGMVSRRRNRSTNPEATFEEELERVRSLAARRSPATRTRPRHRDRDRMILKLDSAKDRKILTKVKSEEGKILKLKKEAMEANQEAMARDFPTVVVPTVAAAAAGKKKTKKVLVKRLITKAQIDFIKAMDAHPCPTRNLTEDQLAMQYSQSFRDRYKKEMYIRDKMRAYNFALVEQHEKFGCAVDESEVEVTDDEGDDVVENY